MDENLDQPLLPCDIWQVFESKCVEQKQDMHEEEVTCTRGAIIRLFAHSLFKEYIA